MSKQLDEILNTYAYSTQQKHQLQLADRSNLDLNYLKNPKYDWEQMREIRLSLEYGVDPTAFCNPEIPSESMQYIRTTLFENAGIYEKENEIIQRKRLKRIVLSFFIGILFFAMIFGLYVNKDYIKIYFEDINLELTDDEVDIGISEVESIDYLDYIKDYDSNNKLELPSDEITDIGNYTVTYKLSNKVKSKEVHLIIHVYDDVCPVINLSTHSITITEGDDIEPSDYIVSVNDNIDGDIQDSINIESNVECNTAGNYDITYSVSDAAGNESNDSIKVTVEKKKEGSTSSNSNSSSSSSSSTNSSSSSNTNSSSSSNTNSSSSSSSSSTKSVTATDKIFYFESVGDASYIYNEAKSYAQAAVNSGKANGYEITPYQQDGVNVGYKVSFF
ncbi:MAG: DUF5011 domain-containing protein [Erysipelotrichaceae bacterium]|nr:DUF5011 domain-containing protein [Erysipelotrichaceae bacterium]